VYISADEAKNNFEKYDFPISFSAYPQSTEVSDGSMVSTNVPAPRGKTKAGLFVAIAVGDANAAQEITLLPFDRVRSPDPLVVPYQRQRSGRQEQERRAVHAYTSVWMYVCVGV
jgi:hypothetical protein